jgi:uncharacterized protein YjiK
MMKGQMKLRVSGLTLIGMLLSFSGWAQHELPFNWGYDLAQPTRSLVLDNELNEISGLSLSLDGRELLAVQDEDGELYFLDPQSGHINRQVNFWKEGDYEGIEQVGAAIYVVKSTGTLYEIQQVGTNEQTVEKYNGFLTSDNDIEGLAYWPQRHQLLLACKSSPGENMNPNRTKAIYAFDLLTHTFVPEPLLLLQRDSVDNYLHRCQQGPGYTKICSIFDPAKEDFDLSPAALAVHPLTGDFYLTSSKGNLLLVITARGEIRYIAKLPKELHRQPEGLSFDVQGNLYISNEQNDGLPPMIYYYPYNPKRS